METINLREITTDALRYWEPRRLAYNAILALVAGYYLIVGWGNVAFRLGLDGLLGLFILAVLANMAYCMAYLVDFVVQISHFREQRGLWRGVLMVVGFTFAAVLTRFFAMSIAHVPMGEIPF